MIDLRPAIERARPAQAPPRSGTQFGTQFVLTAQQFSRIRALARELCGISLSEAKVEMAYNRLSRVLRARGLGGFGEYLELLESGDPASRQEFINALTTNLTRFFREPAHFERLAGLLKEAPAGRALSIWCAGCSTGEEAYTIAMCALETLGARASSVRVLATDVDTDVLRSAASAVYPAEAGCCLSLERLRRFFLQGTGMNEGKIRLRREVRELVRFEHHNLLATDWPRGAQFSAIFCRNVMIYFDRATQGEVLERFAERLHPQGLLFTGHSEYYAYYAASWTRVAHAVYCRARPARPDGAPPRRAPHQNKEKESKP